MDDEFDSALDPMMEPEDGGFQVPMAPPSPDPENDSKNRFREYLEGQMRVNDRRQSPEAMAGRDEQRDRMAGMKGDANLGALLMNSAAKFGNAGGKQVQSDYGSFAKGMEDNINQYQSGMDRDEQKRDMMGDRQGKLYQYLASQQQQGEQNKLKQYMAETQRLNTKKETSKPREQWEKNVDRNGEVVYYNPVTQETRKTGIRENPKDSPKDPNWKVSELSDVNGNPLLVNDLGDTKPIVGAKAKLRPEDRPNATQFAAGTYAKRAEMAEKTLDQLADQGYQSASNWDKLKNLDPTNTLQSDDFRAYDQARRNFVTAVLRKESGASIPEGEMAQEYIKYFPNPNDSKELIAQKRAARQQAMAGLKAEASSAYDKIETVATPDIGSKKDPGTAIAAPASGKQIIKQQYSPSRNQTRITYSDGTTEVKDGR